MRISPATLGWAGAILLVLSVLGTCAWRLAEVQTVRAEIERTEARAERLTRDGQSIVRISLQAETDQRGFLLTAQPAYARAATAARAALMETMASFTEAALLAGVEPAATDRIGTLASRRLQLIDSTIDLSRQGRQEEALAIVRSGDGSDLMSSLDRAVQEVIATASVLRDEADQGRQDLRQTVALIQAVLVLLVVAGFSATAIIAVHGRKAAQSAAHSLKLANEDMAVAHAEADQANAARSRFLAAASHDMRQPLHALSLYLASLERRVSTPDGRRILTNMEAAVGSMTRMFSALLDLARLEAGVLQPTPVMFPVGDLLTDVAQQADEVRRIRAEPPPRVRVVATELEALSDPELLEIILRNLVINSVKYAGDADVLVGCRRAGDHIRIEVHDRGPGMSAQQLKSLFGEFVRGENVRAVEGLGLGLSIVERLSELLGHQVEVRSWEGRGTVFTVLVPRAGGRSRSSASVCPADLDGLRILLVDDEPLVVDAMRVALEDAGAVVLCTHSAEEAYRTPTNSFDLCICDLSLAEDNGLEVLAKLERLARRPVLGLIMTGSTSSGPLNALRSSGRHWVTKPVAIPELLAIISEVTTPGRAT